MASSAYPSSAGSYIFNSIIDRRACLALLALTALPAPALAADAPALLLAQVYRPGLPLQDYWVSEKYDGVRAVWDGQRLLTRGGDTIIAPAGFTAGWPALPMDGELWAGRGGFEVALSTVRQQTPDDAAWRRIRFMVFDLPAHAGPFTERIAAYHQLVRELQQPWVQAVPQKRVASHAALMARLDRMLLWPERMDGNHWIHKARDLFENTATRHGLEDYAAFRAIASILANDLVKEVYLGHEFRL